MKDMCVCSPNMFMRLTNLQGHTNLQSTNTNIWWKILCSFFSTTNYWFTFQSECLQQFSKLFSLKPEHLQKQYIIPNLHLIPRIKHSNCVSVDFILQRNKAKRACYYTKNSSATTGDATTSKSNQLLQKNITLCFYLVSLHKSLKTSVIVEVFCWSGHESNCWHWTLEACYWMSCHMRKYVPNHRLQ